MSPTVTVLDTGCTNLASMRVAFEELGARWSEAVSAQHLLDAERVVLPGVGSFDAGMRSLEESGWVEPLRVRIAEERPTLAICLGLQLLALSSDECPGRAGVAVVNARVEVLRDARPLPHMGWNAVTGDGPAGDAYFANSYAIDGREAGRLRAEGWGVSVTHHGRDFISLLSRGEVLACQFHPELSGDYGRKLLERWLEPASGDGPS